MAAIYAYAAMRSKDAEWRFFWEISVVGSLGLAWQKYQQQRTHHS
jgi:hypothetical protein